MKKLIILFIAITLGGQLNAQKVGPDQLDQIKRMSRRNNHVEKTYQGTVEKLVYSFRDIGGPLTNFIFKRDDGKMMLVRLLRWQGKLIKPYLVEGQKITLTVTGDPLLLDVVLYKDQYFYDLEFSVKSPINGMAIFKGVTSPIGTLNISEIDRQYTINGLSPKQETLFNVRVDRRTRLDKLREMMIMENGDSLIISTNEKFAKAIGDEVSYTRMVRDDKNSLYYKNPNVHYLYGGKETMDLLMQYGVYQMNTNLLNKQELTFRELSSGSDGIVDKGIFINSSGDELELRFNSKDAKKIETLFSNNAKHYVHFQPSLKRNQILAIENEKELVRLNEALGNSYSEILDKETSTYSGKITQLITTSQLEMLIPETLNNYTKEDKNPDSGYFALLIDDMVYVIIPDFTRISIGNNIKVGEEIEISGFLRKKLDNEIRLRDYKIYYPKEITLGKKVYQIKEPFRSL